MDYIRKIFGIPPPQKYNDGYYYWGPYFGEGNNIHEGNHDVDIFENPGNRNPLSQGDEEEIYEMQREFQDVERHLRDFLAPFAGQRGFFEFAPRFFNEGHKGQQAPALKQGPRADQALDSRAVDGETLLAIMEEDKNERNQQLAPSRPQSPFSQFFNIPPGSKSFSRSISIQTTQRPDGVWETRKIVRDGDGNEQVTVSEVPPEGVPSFPLQPDLGPNQFFGGQHHGEDNRGTSIFEKIFGSI